MKCADCCECACYGCYFCEEEDKPCYDCFHGDHCNQVCNKQTECDMEEW